VVVIDDGMLLVSSFIPSLAHAAACLLLFTVNGWISDVVGRAFDTVGVVYARVHYFSPEYLNDRI
jgi:hypothetical protein